MKNNKEILNSFKDNLKEVKINSEVFNLVEKIIDGYDSLTYNIDELYYVNLFFIPSFESNFEKISFLQFSSVIKCSDLFNNNYGLLLKVVNKINISLPIGSILINTENQILFKYIHVGIQGEEIEKNVFLELINLINNIIRFNSNLLNQNNEEELEILLNKI
jgi:hypothetical protein